jgi:hypothetical protein
VEPPLVFVQVRLVNREHVAVVTEGAAEAPVESLVPVGRRLGIHQDLQRLTLVNDHNLKPTRRESLFDEHLQRHRGELEHGIPGEGSVTLDHLRRYHIALAERVEVDRETVRVTHFVFTFQAVFRPLSRITVLPFLSMPCLALPRPA